VPVDLNGEVRNAGGLYVDLECRDAPLEGRQLGSPLLLRLTEHRRGGGEELHARERTVRLGTLHELAQCDLALRDAQEVRRSTHHGLGALKAVERFGVLRGVLELYPFEVELARSSSVGVAGLSVRRALGERGHEGRGDEECAHEDAAQNAGYGAAHGVRA
jgi:hypothetical protein